MIKQGCNRFISSNSSAAPTVVGINSLIPKVKWTPGWEIVPKRMSSVKAGINELEIFGGQVALLEALEISRFVYSDDGMDKSDAKNEAERTNYI